MDFKKRMLFAISALIVLGFFISAISSFKIAQKQATSSLITHEMPLTLDNVYSDIQRDLLQPQLVSSLIANDTFLHHWAETGEQNLEDISDYLNNIKKKYGLFTAFFVSAQSKRYFYSGGLLKTVSKKEHLDNWYFNFLDKDAESELNIDPDMSNDNQLAIFINVKVRDKNNALIGVSGVSLKIENVEAQFDSYYEKYGKSVYFVNNKGEILLSGRNRIKGQSIYEKIGVKDLNSKISSAAEGTFSYQYKGKNYLLTTRYVEELDLLLCVEAESGKISKTLLESLIINIAISLLLLGIVLYLIFKTIDRYHSELENIAWRDHLTGLCNRGYFSLQYKKEEACCMRQKRDMTLLMVDIDFFKQVNDSKGHLQGDKVLRRCAVILQETLRLTDVIARWGGEEFIVLLPDTDLSSAVKLAERLRSQTENDAILQQLTSSGITISIGLCAFDSQKNMDWHISAADSQLYRAKSNGRNCVVY